MPLLSEFPVLFLTVVALALGLVLGSFLNVVIHRVPRGENVAFPGSRCPACGAAIRAYDNVPVLSWLVLRGKARCCKAKISPRYPLVELLGGLAAYAVLYGIVLELPPETTILHAGFLFLVYLLLVLALIALALIDIEYMILPDALTLGGAALGIASAPFRPTLSLLEAVFGAAIGFLIVWLPFDVLYRKLRGVAGMGLGDAKLLALAGAWLGWIGPVFALLAGAMQATLVTLVLLVTRGRIEEPESVARERAELQAALTAASPEERAELERAMADDPLALPPEPGLAKARLAFGPFLCLATLEYLFFGEVLLRELLGPSPW